MATPRPRAATPDQIAEQLRNATASAGGTSGGACVPMTTVATGMLLLGAGDSLTTASLHHFANPGHTKDLQTMWDALTISAPFLRGHLDPLTGWLDNPTETDQRAAAACFNTLTTIDLGASATTPHIGGELLGPVLMGLRGQGDKQAKGAFYTPMNVSQIIAAMSAPHEGATIHEPTCGAGGMVIAAAHVMRRRGLDPTSVAWSLNDIDPLAVALAGVNAVIHGLGHNVTLTCRNALQPAD